MLFSSGDVVKNKRLTADVLETLSKLKPELLSQAKGATVSNNFTGFRTELETNSRLKTVKGPWDVFVIGNIMLDDSDIIIERIKTFWDELDWGATNTAIAYPMSIGYEQSKICSLASSTIIARNTKPEEILDWLVGLFNKLERRYAGTEVSPILALNVKQLFFLPDANRVFYDTNIKAAGPSLSRKDHDPSHYFNSLPLRNFSNSSSRF